MDIIIPTETHLKLKISTTIYTFSCTSVYVLYIIVLKYKVTIITNNFEIIYTKFYTPCLSVTN